MLFFLRSFVAATFWMHVIFIDKCTFSCIDIDEWSSITI